MIYITGDTHGEQNRMLWIERNIPFTKDDTLIICGDFGFLFRNNASEHMFLDALNERGYTICFVDGNHENFPAIYDYPVEIWNGGNIHRIRRNILHLMRGQVYTIENKTFFVMGGAYSIDRPSRIRNISYWDEELPSNEEYQEAISNLKKYEYNVDYILTHTAPREIIRQMGYNPVSQDLEMTGFLEYILHEAKFRHWYFGHWHIDQQMTDCITALWFDMYKIHEIE